MAKNKETIAEDYGHLVKKVSMFEVAPAEEYSSAKTPIEEIAQTPLLLEEFEYKPSNYSETLGLQIDESAILTLRGIDVNGNWKKYLVSTYTKAIVHMMRDTQKALDNGVHVQFPVGIMFVPDGEPSPKSKKQLYRVAPCADLETMDNQTSYLNG